MHLLITPVGSKPFGSLTDDNVETTRVVNETDLIETVRVVSGFDRVQTVWVVDRPVRVETVRVANGIG